ncbi:helix-turn-helix domain-containing protein [Gluconacetobacter diazotrophicus]|uniref:Helix-turn-helix domain-containing protein n=1 Tax=Gluconacetobacter diazotrophicus TaxID=33996 RepID=A0A7W4NIP9_GLUDI|nr:helix-turn-helix domain-containing protein [Gluconacetobacter diazotrophicus]MBB2158472.1 helix-turn-helix domain-containing protein [Gluconacetobacter diazotrophicus]
MLITEQEVADMLAVDIQAVRKMRKANVRGNLPPGPPPIFIGCRMIRYRREDVEAWVVARVEAGQSAASTRASRQKPHAAA